MARYRPRHSARSSELERTARVRRTARLWTAIAAAALLAIIGVRIVTGGGWDAAVRSFTGQDLIEREIELISELESATVEASPSVEASAP